jgi:hypothetical protein
MKVVMLARSQRPQQNIESVKNMQELRLLCLLS